LLGVGEELVGYVLQGAVGSKLAVGLDIGDDSGRVVVELVNSGEKNVDIR